MNEPVSIFRVGSAPVAVVGAACRLPGAPNESAFWNVLESGRCTVGALPAGRWRAEKYQHPRATEPGFSYTFNGGYLSEPFAFDPTVFGISPREARQIDPQQRLLLEVVWEALEDAGIAPSSLAGKEVGVYVGASSLDYGNLHMTDPAAIESHFMTGNTLSIVSNRISYVFDWRGPSFTVDTACSSSLVAFSEAMAAVESGRVEIAVVAGVNLLLSPGSFIGFSRASMLSPTGLCRPFSAQGDGYVRAEGAVAFLIMRGDIAKQRNLAPRAMVLASGINSDGRTSGISLPSADGQRALLERVYGDSGINPGKLAFVEAHGTGTRVGDPAEAQAIGQALGQKRQSPLPMGSVKSNIGHLEPASGLAGAFKAILAMEHRVLPRSLHLGEPNPLIDFAALNLEAAVEPIQLASHGVTLHCGVSSFGFGGTNAHVIMREPDSSELPVASRAGKSEPEFLVLSAQTREALAETATRYADLIEAGDVTAAVVAGASAHRRERLSHRLAMPLADAGAMIEELRAFADTKDTRSVTSGTAPSAAPVVAFVFSGNGAQWPGMGRAAYANNPAFRKRMQQIDAIFKPLAGWSLVEAINDPELAERLPKTSVAQPLLFAIQSSVTAALAEYGLKPAMVFGHSVGEVAAAEAAGALTLADAVRLIVNRSEQQEKVRGLGKMAATNSGVSDTRQFLRDLALGDVEIAAENSASSVTLSGPEASIQEAAKAGRKRRIAIRVLDLDYPFHSPLLDPLHEALLQSLAGLKPKKSSIDFISSVTGDVLDGKLLDGEYWWRNVREQVKFRSAIEAATAKGATLFIEIGARPILRANLNDTMKDAGIRGDYIQTLDEKDAAGFDPIRAIVGRALVRGARLDEEKIFGAAPLGRVGLPAYPWQHKTYNLVETNEALNLYGGQSRHPLIGARLSQGSPEWRTLLDTDIVPYLVDHKVDGEVVVPGAGLAEMLLAVARETFPEGPIGIEDFDILAPLVLLRDAMREISVRLHDDTQLVEVWSRPRLAGDEWSLHARGRIVQVVGAVHDLVAPPGKPFDGATADDIYSRARETGMEYGPSFRRVRGMRYNDKVIYADFAPTDMPTGLFDRAQVLSPVGLDAAFHPLFQTMTVKKGIKKTYLPVRFGQLRVYRDSAEISRALLVLERSTDDSMSVSIALYDADDQIVATLAGGLFRSVVLSRSTADQLYFHVERTRIERLDRVFDGRSVARKALSSKKPGERPDSWLLLEAFARSLAHDVLVNRIGIAGATVEASVEKGSIASTMAPLTNTLLVCLSSAGLATENGDSWLLEADSGLPDPATILATFAAEYPASSVELVLAAKVLSHLDKAIATGHAPTYRQQLIEQFETSTLLFEPLLERAASIIETTETAMKPDPVNVVVLEPGCLGIIRMLRPFIHDRRVKVTVASADHKRLDHIAARIGADNGVEFLELGPDAAAGPVFNLALAMTSDSLFGSDAAFGSAVSARLAPNAALVVLQPPADPVFDVLLGLTEGWFSRTLDPHFPVGRLPGIEDTRRALVSAGYRDIQTIEGGDGVGTILVATPAQAADTTVGEHPPLVIAANGTPSENAFVTQLLQKARAAGRSVRSYAGATPDENRRQAWRTILGAETRGKRIDVADVTGVERDGDDQSRLEHRIAEITSIVEAARGCGNHIALWIVVRGLEANAHAVDPVAEAIWSFARVAMNEYPEVDIRLIDIAGDLSATEAAERLTGLLDAPGAEAELLVDASGLWAHRVGRGRSADADKTKHAPAAVLELPHKGALSQFIWSGIERVAPGPNEVEVEVAAAGLNFRDVMMSMGLLDDDVLDAGLAGAVLGFECSGRVVRVGEKVRDLQPGSRVMGFAAKAFATYVTADRRVFVPVPDRLPIEAAATVPVAFLTAWYSLIEVARIKRGEWVLIHGAAGGVGLAAMQIARWKGAKIVATVGSPDKRALVELFGADKIFDSRSLTFAEDVKRELGGVDIVLNSLYGEAMLASVKCLKPFGRFVELGKRDYVENTWMGLRPFRRNLSYFGVDIDQLLLADPDTADRLMRELERAFEDGNLTPLPYRVFEAEDVPSAFRLMQSAGHVGKILIAPPRRPVPLANGQARFKPGAGVHLVVGGTGGFGFEAAAWLAEQGAQNIIVASRKGALSGALEVRAAAIRATGARLEIEQVDVTDTRSVDAMIGRILSRYGKLAGVIHTAMVLEDRLMSGIDDDMVHKVLSPKVGGAIQLDRATRNLKLDYFVVYSSATTLIGSPGQSAYVAANGYLQGLARKRRSEGLPALAVAWGAISDAGVLARDGETAKKLARATGVVGIASRDALDQLGHMLVNQNGEATHYFADIHPGGAMRDMKLLQTPAFARVFRNRGDADVGEGVDILKLIDGLSEVEARVKVAELLAVEVGRILRLSSEELDIHRPLSELGMDSLMGLELRMDIEKRFGVELPLIAITSVTNLTDLAGRMIANIRPAADATADAAGEASGATIERGLYEKHTTDDVDADNLAAVAEAIGEQRRSVKRLQ